MSDATSTGVKGAARGNWGRQNPFPGLRSYDGAFIPFFFGRADQQVELLSRLGRNRFLAVIGVSGSGKSSLVSAGLLPLVQKGFIPDAGTAWRIARLRPGDQPVKSLAGSLADAFGETGLSADNLWARLLGSGDQGLLEITDVLEPSSKLLIFVDQFEELFRFKDRDERDKDSKRAVEEAADFVNLLLTALENSRIHIVITMRSDFIGECAQFRGLPEQINAGQYLIPRLTLKQQKETIQRPVWACNAKISQELVDRLVRDVGSDPQQLPILQHVLMRVWHKHWEKDGRGQDNDGKLDLDDYRDIGGFDGALDAHAKALYSDFSEEEQWIARRLFRRITIKDRANRVARRPATLGHIYEVTDAVTDVGRQRMVQKVIARYRTLDSSFLAPHDEHRPADDIDQMIDINHESLCDLWKDLHKWVEEEAAFADDYRMISDEANLYNNHERSYCDAVRLESVLHKYHPLDDPPYRDGWTKAWCKRYPGSYELVITYLRESASYQDSEKKRRDQEELDREQNKIDVAVAEEKARLYKHRIGLLVWGVVALVAALGVLIPLNRNKDLALTKATLALKAVETNFNVEKDPDGALKAAIQLFAADSGPESLDALYHAFDLHREKFTLTGHSDSATTVDISGDGQWIATGSGDGKVLLWDARTGQNLSQIDASSKSVNSVAFYKPKVKQSEVLLLTGSDDGTAVIWKAVVPGKFSKFCRFTLPKSDLAGDSKEPLSATNGIADGKSVTTLPEIWTVAFSHDGKLVATGSTDSVVRLWDATCTHQQPVHSFEGHRDSIAAVAFNADDSLLASGSIDRTARIWNVKAPFPELFGPLAHLDIIYGLAFNGKELATASWNGLVTLWDDHGNKLRTINPKLNQLWGVAFSPDGSRLAIAARRGIVSIVDAKSGSEMLRLYSNADSFTEVAFDPTGNILVTGTLGKNPQVWNVELITLAGQGDDVTSMALSDNGQTLVTGDEKSTTKLWDSRGGTPLPELATDFGPKGNPEIRTVAISPSGNLTAAAYSDGTMAVWRAGGTIADKVGLKVHVTTDMLYGAAFDSTETRVATASWDRMVRIWDIPSRALIEEFPIPERAYAVAFSSDGKLVAAGGRPKKITLYDLEMHRVQLSDLDLSNPNDSRVQSLAFSKVGKLLAAGSIDGHVTVWDLAQKRRLSNLEGHREQVNAVRFSSDGTKIATASDDGTAKIWNVHTGALLRTAYGHKGPVLAVAFDGEGQLITAGADRTVIRHRFDSDHIEQLLIAARVPPEGTVN